MPNFGVVVFPGSNCDHDCYYSIKNFLGQQCSYLWHEETGIEGIDCVIIPGGFSYGDYLRTGSIARFSPIMNSIKTFAEKGKPIIGICNGFQILVESGLLPGAFIHNSSLKFVCKWTNLLVENTKTPFTSNLKKGDILRIPVANGEGNFFTSEAGLKNLNDNRQIVFRYCDSESKTSIESNPNGSTENIAGICNKNGNVLGMMPHPERCCEEILGGRDGKLIFESVISWIQAN